MMRVYSEAGSIMPEQLFAGTLPQTLYFQVREALRGRILDGEYRQHQRLPSESELMGAFGVSRITVRQALNDLVKEGLIFKLAGKGSYVSKPRPVQNLSRLQGFGEAMSRLGYKSVNRMVGLVNLPATARVAAALLLEEGETVTEIRRARYLDNEPVALDTSYVRPELGKRLAREDLVARDIFLIIENDYGIPLGHADVSISAILAAEEQAQWLQIRSGAPLLHLERLTHERNGNPLELDDIVYRGDAFSFQARVERD